MTQRHGSLLPDPLHPGPLLLRLGHTSGGDAVPLHLDRGGTGLEVYGEWPAVFALARSFMIQLTAHTLDRSPEAPTVVLRSDGRITVDGAPVIDLVAEVSGRAPPQGALPRLTLDDVPWARLDQHGSSLRLRCELTSRAEFPALVRAARMHGGRSRGRHAAADENGGPLVPPALIS